MLDWQMRAMRLLGEVTSMGNVVLMDHHTPSSLCQFLNRLAKRFEL